MNQCESDDSIEGEFIQSWDRIEQFFDSVLEPGPWKDQVLQFISQLRHAGYDRKLRAGQSLFALVVSRSRRHGLRLDQPCVCFWLHDGVMDMQEEKDVYVHLADSTLSPLVEAALARLLTQPID
jgi:hypothetical protein